MPGRYAVYYVPDFESGLYRLGSDLLGRCVRSGQPLPRPQLKAVTEEELARHTRQASAYGFHGTIVAPFETAADEACLSSALASIVRDSEAFALSGLRLAAVDDAFAAIVPDFMPEKLKLLEQRCIKEFSRFRRPLSEEDIARRGPLSPKLWSNLVQWGYHLVFDEFKFHLTVADSLPNQADDFLAALKSYLEPVLNIPLVFDRLALFNQASRTEPFICRRVFLLQDNTNEHGSLNTPAAHGRLYPGFG